MNSLDEEGRTPLIVAAQYGQSSVVGKLFIIKKSRMFIIYLCLLIYF